MTIAALIFDVDGTLADTEGLHRAAFNEAFALSGFDWRWDEPTYARLLNVAGGKERILHFWRTESRDVMVTDTAIATATVARIHMLKTAIYETKVRGGQLSLRPGVLRLINEAISARIDLAIATTTTPANIDALLTTPLGSEWRKLFRVIGDAVSAQQKKPHPMVYRQVVAALGHSPGDCVAFEDSENGLNAARAINLPTVITPTAYTRDHNFSGALIVLPHLGDPGLPIPFDVPALDSGMVTINTLTQWRNGTLANAPQLSFVA